MYVRARVKIHSEVKEFEDVALVNTRAAGIIIDEALAMELGLRGFGKAKVVTLGTAVECYFADVKNVIIEDVEIGPRRLVVCKFPDEVEGKLKSLGFSKEMILGISAIEDAGYFPNTVKGTLERVGYLAL